MPISAQQYRTKIASLNNQIKTISKPKIYNFQYEKNLNPLKYFIITLLVISSLSILSYNIIDHLDATNCNSCINNTFDVDYSGETLHYFLPIAHKVHNKYIKIINGNIEKNSCSFSKLKVVHCNKGSSLFINSLQTINDIIDNYKPDILCLAEANVTLNYLN